MKAIPVERNGRFPVKLHGLLCAAEKGGYQDIVSWLPDGKSFKVHDRDRFERFIMPKYFGSSKYRTFQKSLNMWNFTSIRIQGRAKGGLPKGACFHPHFIRETPLTCLRIMRQPVAQMQKLKKSSESKKAEDCSDASSESLKVPKKEESEARTKTTQDWSDGCEEGPKRDQLGVPPLSSSSNDAVLGSTFKANHCESSNEAFSFEENTSACTPDAATCVLSQPEAELLAAKNVPSLAIKEQPKSFLSQIRRQELQADLLPEPAAHVTSTLFSEALASPSLFESMESAKISEVSHLLQDPSRLLCGSANSLHFVRRNELACLHALLSNKSMVQRALDKLTCDALLKAHIAAPQTNYAAGPSSAATLDKLLSMKFRFAVSGHPRLYPEAAAAALHGYKSHILG